MTKEQIIGKAYGESYAALKDHISKNGYVKCKIGSGLDYNYFGFTRAGVDVFTSDSIVGYYKWRPKLLCGLESNYGWIQIKSDKDLPIEGEFRVHPFGRKEATVFTAAGVRLCYLCGRITHYKPVEVILPPLY